jgi:IS605 OrfB family transposase
MRQSFTPRLYPTTRQQRLLSEQIEEARWLWNTFWNQRQQRQQVVARTQERTQERTRWKREDFAHQHRRRLVNTLAVIAGEDLSVTSMVQNRFLAKSIHDAAWSQFATGVAWKAAWADSRSIAAPPAHTSHDCSGCGTRTGDLTLGIGGIAASAVAWSSTEISTRVAPSWQRGDTAWAWRPGSSCVYAWGVVTRPWTDQLTSARGHRRLPVGA